MKSRARPPVLRKPSSKLAKSASAKQGVQKTQESDKKKAKKKEEANKQTHPMKAAEKKPANKKTDPMKDAKKALAKAEAAARAKQAQQQAEVEIEQEGGEEEEPEMDLEVDENPREGLARADTQDIEAAARNRKAYKARKERFYRSLKSFVLSSGCKPVYSVDQYTIYDYLFCMVARVGILAFWLSRSSHGRSNSGEIQQESELLGP